MSKFIFTLFFSLSLSISAQVKWLSIENALKAQEQHPKKILIHFYTNDCIPCKVIETETFAHPVIYNYLKEHYYLVKFNAESYSNNNIFGRIFTKRKGNKFHDFTQFMNVVTIPSLVFIDEQTMPITTIQGSLNAKELDPYLHFFIEGDYKKVLSQKDWERYRKKFKSKIND